MGDNNSNKLARDLLLVVKKNMNIVYLVNEGYQYSQIATGFSKLENDGLITSTTESDSLVLTSSGFKKLEELNSKLNSKNRFLLSFDKFKSRKISINEIYLPNEEIVKDL
ncbi:MAG: hypothetical protein M5R37_09790 [Melioribacteraceae bacterium]|nr:hypothetical protein [Melioribacteraceae bacterium]